jgi:Sulfotransferase family
VVLDEWKVIYVITPKAMCTSMLWLMAGLQNEDLARDVAHSRAPEVTRALAVHDPAIWRRTRWLHLLPADVIEKLASEDGWFRFALTRHPVDRLWSAWQSKLLLREPTWSAAYGTPQWFPRTPMELPEGAAALDAIAKDFERFVATLAQDPQLLMGDTHWAPQSYLLRPEVFPYSEIGRVEAAAVTLGRLENHLQAQGWRGTFDLKRFNATLLPRGVIRDPTLLRLIEKIYSDDMTAFGYEPAKVGNQPSPDASAVAVKALAELVDRHERISDLLRMIAPARDADLLLAKVERNPEDARSVFFLAQSYFALGDFVNARKCFARRVEMGGWDEEVYFAMFRIAESMRELGEPWPDVQDAFLRAWEFRPTRAEPLFEIAYRYRVDQRYRLGYLFAKRAAAIPFPEQDLLFVRPDVYAWRAIDEQAVCASWIDKHAEAFTLWRRLLARPDVPDEDRQRIAGNRDICVPAMIEAALSYPDALVQRLVDGPGEAEVVVSLIAGPDRTSTEHTLNTFLNCCTDVSQVGRFLVVDAGLSAQDRAMLLERYGFLDFCPSGPDDGPSAHLAQIRAQVHQRFWLHLGAGWRFFAPESFITRLRAVLEAEAQVFQVGINFADAVKLTGASAAEQAVRRAPDAGRYVLADVVASGPAMFDTARLDQAGDIGGTDTDAINQLGQRAARAWLRTASLDEVLCIA